MEKARLYILAGFLGSGKTTLLRQLLQQADPQLRIAVCENEFGEVGLDGLQLRDDRFELLELNAGCICCTLGPALVMGIKTLCARFHPHIILMEPTGLAGLADVRALLEDPGLQKIIDVRSAVAVVSGRAFAHDMPRFERYYGDLIASASCISLNRTDDMTQEQREELLGMIVQRNFAAPVLEELQDGAQLWAAMDSATLPPAGEPQPRNWLSTFQEVAVSTGWAGSRGRVEDFFAGSQLCGDILRAKGFAQDEEGHWWQGDYAGGELCWERAGSATSPWLQIIGRNLAIKKIKSFFAEHE